MKKYFFIRRFLLFTIPLVLTIILVGFYSLYTSRAFSIEQAKQNDDAFIAQTCKSLETIMGETDTINLNISYDPFFLLKLKSLLTDAELSGPDRLEAINVTDSVLQPLVNSKPYISSVYLYIENNNDLFFSSQGEVVSLNDYRDTAWYSAFRMSTTSDDVWMDYRQFYPYNFEKIPSNMLTVYETLHLSGKSQKSGVIVLNLNAGYLENYVATNLPEKDQSFLMLDGNGKVLLNYSKTLDIKDGDTVPKSVYDHCMVSEIKSSRYDLRYVLLTPNSTFAPLSSSHVGSMLIFLLVSLLIGLVVTFYLTRQNFRNMLAIVNIFYSAEKGAPLPPLPDRTRDINSYLLQNIIKTFIEHNYLKVQLSERKYRLQTMEMLAMQSQLNPHFLFNTLKTIYWKTVQLTGGNNEASEMIDHLSALLHYSINSPDKKVTLEEEIRYTNHYIDIQRIRYENRFEIIWYYDERHLSVQVVRLIFQPLIENVIYHAARADERVFVKIKIIRYGDELYVSVIDNGAGIPKARLDVIRENLKQGKDYSSFVGLQNTFRRLQLTYGEGYGLSVLSKEGWATSIHFRLPVNEADRESPQKT